MDEYNKKGRFEDTNKVFEKPKKIDYEVNEKNADLISILIAEKIEPHVWKNNQPTAQMLEDGNHGTKVIRHFSKKL